MARSWVGGWFGKWVGDWLGKILGGVPPYVPPVFHGPVECPLCKGDRSAHRNHVGGVPVYRSPWDGYPPLYQKTYFAPGTIWPGYTRLRSGSYNPATDEWIETCPTCKGAGVLWV